MEFPDFDIVVAQGFLDRLTIEEVDRLFKKAKSKFFLFTTSEKKISLSCWIHSIYVYLSYGWKTNGYVPKYYPMDQMIKIAEDNGCNDVLEFRNTKLRFGTFLYKLD